MSKVSRIMAFAVIAMGLSSLAAAQGFDARRLFFGAGLSQNKVSGLDNSTGFQVFGGYNFAEVAPKLHVDAEAGFMDTGKLKAPGCSGPFCDAKANGLWANGVVRYMVAPNIELIGRAGYDFGDDNGLMFGIGAGYIASNHLKLRLEFVSRDNVDSLQFNVVFYPW